MAAVSIATTATQILGVNPDRRETIIYNAGSNAVYIDFSATPTVAGGVPIAAAQALTLQNCVGPVFGIVAAATEEIRVISRTVR